MEKKVKETKRRGRISKRLLDNLKENRRLWTHMIALSGQVAVEEVMDSFQVSIGIE
jgi:hypothetical protein